MTYINKNVLLVFPIFNSKDGLEIKNARLVKDWLKKNIAKFYDLGVGVNPIICGVGVSNNDADNLQSTEFLKKTTKANVIRHGFSQMFKEQEGFYKNS